jgi:hypothetical protein
MACGGHRGARLAPFASGCTTSWRIAEIMRAGAERAEVTVEQVVRELSHPELSAI